MLVEVGNRQAEIAAEQLATQRLHDVAADVARAVGLHEVAQPAQDEQPHERDRHQPDHAGVLVDEGAVEEELDEGGPARVGGGKYGHAEHTDQKDPEVGPEISQQPAIGAQRTRRHPQLAAASGLATHR